MNQRSEYRTQGRIPKESIEGLLHRLRGVCDSAAGGGTPFREHEMILTMSSAGVNAVQVQIRRSLDNVAAPWHLRYYGPADVGVKSATVLVRNCIELTSNDALPQFVQEMGFVMQQEFVAEGWLFLKGPFKICVFSVFKMPIRGDTTKTEEIPTVFINIITTAVAGVGQEAVVHEMNSLAEQLKPLVTLSKPDIAHTIL